MDKRELKRLIKEILKEDMSLYIDDERIGGEHRITVRVALDGETISSEYFNLYD